MANIFNVLESIETQRNNPISDVDGEMKIEATK